MADYFKRRRDEDRGDRHAGWGASWWLFEVDSGGQVLRQIEIYDNGPTKRYGPEVIEDDDGGLASEPLNPEGEWSPWRIASDEFEAAWSAH